MSLGEVEVGGVQSTNPTQNHFIRCFVLEANIGGAITKNLLKDYKIPTEEGLRLFARIKAHTSVRKK